jgi:putative thioredoxin
MEPIIGQNLQAPAGTIKDSSEATFAEDVLAASREVPVIVDFWAPWCGPCKTLGPLLEKVVREAGGQVKLVKVNVDENQRIAQQLRIQSIPAVYAFDNGQPVDGFVGALPESQIRSFVQRLTGNAGPSPLEQALEAAQQALQAGDMDRAASFFGQILRAEPQNAAALAGLAQCYLNNGDVEQAKQVLAQADPSIANRPEIASVRAAIELAEQAGDAGDLAALEAAVANDPADLQARFDLANAYVAANRKEQAADALLECIRRDRKWNDEAARKQLLKLFEAWGAMDPVTVAARRKLSSLLFS